jgi:hypothetical protein
MSLSALGPRVSPPPAGLAKKVQAASGPAIALPPIDDKDKQREVSKAETESVVSSESPTLPANEPYWVTDIALSEPAPANEPYGKTGIESSVPPPADETPPPPSSTPKEPEEVSSRVQASIESRLLMASLPLACSTILLVIFSLYGGSGLGWLVLGGLAWSGIILSAGVVIKTTCDFVRKA